MIAVLERQRLREKTAPGVCPPGTDSPDARRALSLGGFSPGRVLLLGVFALRLWSLTQLSGSQFLPPTSGDMLFYNDWALRILRGNWTEHTAFYGLPLYAYLLAGIYKVCGYSPFIPGLLQAGCEAITAFLIYKIGQAIFVDSTGETRPASDAKRSLPRWRGTTVGMLAGLGWAFFVPAQGYSIVLMPTSWLVCAFWFVVWEIVRRKEAPRGWTLLFLGTLIGFVAMGVATILFLIPLVIVALFWQWSRTMSQRLIGAGLVMAGALFGASPAWIHNYYIAKDPVFLSAHGGVNFWIGNNPVATGYPKFPPGLRAGQQAMLQDSITTAEKAAGRSLKRSEVSVYWSEQARAWIQAHPGAWGRLLGKKIRNFWSAFQYDDISVITALREQSIIFPGPGFGLVAAWALPGMLLACWKFRNARWIAAAIFLHMASLLTVFVTERYRLAAVPGLLLFAAYALWQLWDFIVRQQFRYAGFFASSLLLSAVWISVPQSDSTLWALDSYNSGLQALERQELATARRKLDIAYAYSPYNAEVNFAQGNLHLTLGETSVARSFYLSASRLDPGHAGAYNNLGVLALQEGRWNLAMVFFQQALARSPSEAKLHFLLAQVSLKIGDLPKARAEIAQAVELEGARPEFLALEQKIEHENR